MRGSLDLRGWQVTLDSQRGPMFTRQGEPGVSELAKGVDSAFGSEPPQGSPSVSLQSDYWSVMSNGRLNNEVYAIAVSENGDVYVGGLFTAAAGYAVTLNFIAKFSGGAWSALPHNGLNNAVNTIA
ncbi:MAG: hypothetical protein Q7O66_13510, partial [Dehalococcoidia bacterium]|nr:hypothetical protein [Dehalococcoidia bacterium]